MRSINTTHGQCVEADAERVSLFSQAEVRAFGPAVAARRGAAEGPAASLRILRAADRASTEPFDVRLGEELLDLVVDEVVLAVDVRIPRGHGRICFVRPDEEPLVVDEHRGEQLGRRVALRQVLGETGQRVARAVQLLLLFGSGV